MSKGMNIYGGISITVANRQRINLRQNRHSAIHCLKILELKVHELQLESTEAMDSDCMLGYCWLSNTYGGLNWLLNWWWWPMRSGYVPAKIIRVIYVESIFYIQHYIFKCIILVERFHKETTYIIEEQRVAMLCT